MVWLKKHLPQLAVLVASCLVAAGLHFGKLTPDQATAIGLVLAGVGIHLPPIVYKVPPTLPAILIAAGVLAGMNAAACSKPKIAKTEYGAQLQACIDIAHNRAEADACIEHMRLEWSDAGAPPALVFTDGGDQ